MLVNIPDELYVEIKNIASDFYNETPKIYPSVKLIVSISEIITPDKGDAERILYNGELITQDEANQLMFYGEADPDDFEIVNVRFVENVQRVFLTHRSTRKHLDIYEGEYDTPSILEIGIDKQSDLSKILELLNVIHHHVD